jgi:hypothetical protein
MGGRPKVHKTDYNGETDLGNHRLNLSAAQLDEVATKLGLPNTDRQKLAVGQEPVPPDGAVMLTYRGRYVRIEYQKGQVYKITPPDLNYQN